MKSKYLTMRCCCDERGFLIPGLWDMHVHSIANIAWDMRLGSVNNTEWHFPLFLAYGVTGIRNMGDAKR